MKKLFYHLRQEWYKYLLEIIVITIGILGAFALNNWNESNQKAIQEKEILTELLKNLRADSVDNVINMEWYTGVAHSAKVINQALEEQRPWHDSLAAHFGSLYRHGISTFNVSAYENLKAKGFDLISNDSIRIALTNLHSVSYNVIEKNEEEFSRDNYNAMVLPILTSRLRMESWWRAIPLNYESLWEDSLFQETVRFRGITMEYVGANIRSANKRVTALMQMIEKELRQ